MSSLRNHLCHTMIKPSQSNSILPLLSQILDLPGKNAVVEYNILEVSATQVPELKSAKVPYKPIIHLFPNLVWAVSPLPNKKAAKLIIIYFIIIILLSDWRKFGALPRCVCQLVPIWVFRFLTDNLKNSTSHFLSNLILFYSTTTFTLWFSQRK
jgi:hypothetical protein